MLEQLPTSEDYQRRLADLRSLNERPTFLYGAGFYAVELIAFLESHGIAVAGCFVDDAYAHLDPGNGLRPKRFDDVVAAHPEFNVVVAFTGDPSQAAERVISRRSSQIKRIEIIDCRFWQRFAPLTHGDLSSNFSKFQQTFDWLTDDLSRRTFLAFLRAKVLFDPIPLKNVRVANQYFPVDLPAFRPQPNDVFIDAGAFTGDTLADVFARTGNVGCAGYIAFEPEPRNAKLLRQVIEQKQIPNTRVIEKGVWDYAGELKFQDNDDSRSHVSDTGTIVVPVETIDRLNVPATFIKMDIEGSELQALQGGAETITRHRPRLAIAAYHKLDDLVALPSFIKSLRPDYQLDLRIHTLFSEELVLYAR